MNTVLKIAWRNIWRNKRRTLITAGSIFFAVLLSILMMSIQKGAWDKMIDNVVNFYFGYGQIHLDGYWDEQTIDKSFALTPELRNLPDKTPDLGGITPRLETFALGSHETYSYVVRLVGMDPAAENQLTGLSDRIIEGEYLTPEDKGIIIAEGVAEKFKVGISDTLVLIGQGYHGVNAAGKYPVKGIVRFGSPDLNKVMVYLPLLEAQRMHGAEGLINSIALNVSNRKDVPGVLKKVRAGIDTEKYEVMSWQEMMPELLEAREVDTAGNLVILFILYVIITFGIFGTILMMTKEREYEFGVLTAIGMRREKLGIIIWIETVILGLVGVVAGSLASLPLVIYLNHNPLNFNNMSEEMASTYEKFGFDPVFPAAIAPEIFWNQAILVLIITTILALYPLIKISRLKPVEAMRA
ncbi:MAG: ABC transporter permease [Saprospiraceae bacterium]|nr:ABC transporter permease [Saprospiraceae bacterium]